MNSPLAPTLVVGLGKVGVTAAFRVHAKTSSRRAGDGPCWIRSMGVDCDPGVLRSIAGVDPNSPAHQDFLLTCRFQPPGNYYKKWEDLKHLSAWLDSQYVFQIPTTGGSGNHRPLGRLAVFENHRRLVSRIKAELDVIQQAAQTELARSRAADARQEAPPPRIVLIAGMGGGMGSGSLIDLGYIAQKVLTDSGFAPARVEAIVIAGIERDPKHRDLVTVNHFALAQDLLQYTQEDAELSANYGDGPQRFTGPAVTRCFLFDAMAESLPEPRIEAALDAVSELVWRTSASEVGDELESHTSQWPMYRGFGWFELIFPRKTLERRLALRMAISILDRWLENLNPGDADRIAHAAEAELANAGLDPQSIADLIYRLANTRLDEPIIAKIAGKVKAVHDRIAADSKSESKAVFEAAMQELRDLLGSESGDPRDETGDLKLLWAIRDGAKEAAGQKLGPVSARVDAVMDQPGPRLDRVRYALRGYSDYFVKHIDNQKIAADSSREKCGRLRLALTEKLESKLMGAMSGAAGLVSNLEQYANAKVALRLSECTADVLTTLRGRLSDRLKDMISARQGVDRLRDEMQRELAIPSSDGAGFCSQPIFPGGLLTLDDALKAAEGKFGPRAIDELEQRVQKLAILPAGGMAKVVLGDMSLAKGFGAKMAEVAAEWVRERLGTADVATAFLDRHAAEPSNADAELAAFVGWAAPTCPVKPPKSPADASPGREILLYTLPPSEAGERCRKTIETALPGVEHRSRIDADEIIFCRLVAHESLPRMLPQWVLDASRAYKAACQSRQSPELFRDLSDL